MRLRAGCPPARGGGAAASQRPPSRPPSTARRGGPARPGPSHRPGPPRFPRLCLCRRREGDGDGERHPSAASPRSPVGLGRCSAPHGCLRSLLERGEGQPGGSRCRRGWASRRGTAPALRLSLVAIQRLPGWSFRALLFISLLCNVLGNSTAASEPPRSALQDPRVLGKGAAGTGGARASRVSVSPGSCRRLFSAAARKFGTQKERRAGFLLGQCTPSSVKGLLQPSSESPKEATTKRPKERQGFEPEGMSVHTCTHRHLPKLPVNSALLPRWFALWQQGSLSLSVSPVHPGHHVCPQHCAGQGTSLFCLGR